MKLKVSHPRRVRMLSRSSLLAVVVGLWLAALPGTASTAGLSCEDWNTSSFFISADSADVALCLKAGADLTARDKNGVTPLHFAAGFSRTPAVVAELIRAGADLAARDKTGSTPLHVATPMAWLITPPAVVVELIGAGVCGFSKFLSLRTVRSFC